MQTIIDKWQPKLQTSAAGTPRHVGVEIEYAGLPLSQSAGQIQTLFGGETVRLSRYTYRVESTRYGDFHLELDSSLLQKMEQKAIFKPLDTLIENASQEIETLLDKTAVQVVPYEIAAPPVPFDAMPQMDALVSRLRLGGALGTTHALHYAFGVHLNVEVPGETIQDVLPLFQAFLVLQKWIERQSELDIARQVSPFINDFPRAYVKKVLDTDYHPTPEQFIRDYVEHNPTRNRALDLLPLLAWWDAELIDTLLPDEKNSPRPAFHYRLPNSKIDLFRWNLQQEWCLWLIIEILARDEATLKTMTARYTEHLDAWISNPRDWVQECHARVLGLLSGG